MISGPLLGGGGFFIFVQRSIRRRKNIVVFALYAANPFAGWELIGVIVPINVAKRLGADNGLFWVTQFVFTPSGFSHIVTESRK